MDILRVIEDQGDQSRECCRKKKRVGFNYFYRFSSTVVTVVLVQSTTCIMYYVFLLYAVCII